MDVFDLFAKISLDSSDYDRSLQQSKDAFEEFATKAVMFGKTVGSAITGIISNSVNAFSSFQQLEGGVETLFGAGGKGFEEWSKTFSESSDSMADYVDAARKVLNGDFGVGKDRRDLLAQAGYDPDTVQQMVENLINGVEVASGVSADTISANMQTAEEKYQSLQRAQDTVMENARNAYMTAGLSANEYMDTVTTFSSSLIQGLKGDTEKASIYADRALRDMSDNANKMGTNMASIQAAYQGFSKQNYTMLDNLKLGYGGTKTEMERLIKDAAALTDVQDKLGITVDANSMSFDNIVNAISVMQENMGIAGTTSKEAATTIEGSTKMMNAAWKNMLTAMVTGGDWFQQSLDGLVESVVTWSNNIIPAVTAAMNGFASLVSKIVPLVASKLPTLVQDLLPSFINAISEILGGILDALPELIKVLDNLLPMVTSELSNLIPSIIDFILEGIPLVIEAGITLLAGLVSGLADNVDTIVPQLTQGIIDMVDHIGQIISGGGVGLASAGLALLSGLANALVDAVPDVLTQITQMVDDLIVSIGNVANGEDGNLLTTSKTILTNLIDGLMTTIPTLIPELTSAVAEFITQFADLAATNTTDMANAAIGILNSLVTSLGEAGTIQSVIGNITTAVMAIIDAIINVITNLDIGTFANACASIITQIADGLVDGITIIADKLPELITGIVAWLTNPENYFELLEAAVTIGGNLISKVPEILVALASALKGIVTGIAKHFKDNKEEILTGIVDGFSGLLDKVETIWTEKIKPAFDELGDKIWNFFLQFDWGETLLNFCKSIANGITDLWTHVKTAFEGEDGLGAKIKNFFTSFDWGVTIMNFVKNVGQTIKDKWGMAKTAFTGEDGFFGKIKSWFGEIDLVQIITDFIQKIKDAIEGAWDSFKEWFTGKISGLFSGIKVPNWIKKLFGKGEGNAEDETTMDLEDEKLVDMPENMFTLDYSNLEPIPEETLASYQALADAINAINSAIGGGEGEKTGLNTALSALTGLLDSVLASGQSLAEFLSGGLIDSISSLINVLCVTSTDEEGNTDAGGGNTLYNSVGAVYGLFEDLLATSQLLARYWVDELITASQKLRTESGKLSGVVRGLGNVASTAASKYHSLAEEIYGVIDAYMELLAATGGKNLGSGKSNVSDMFKASGGPVEAGNTYIVGEHGPELFSPSRAGYITSNEDLMARGRQEINVSINFNGDVIGDESSISAYVNRAAKRAIQEEVYAAS